MENKKFEEIFDVAQKWSKKIIENERKLKKGISIKFEPKSLGDTLREKVSDLTESERQAFEEFVKNKYDAALREIEEKNNRSWDCPAGDIAKACNLVRDAYNEVFKDGVLNY